MSDPHATRPVIVDAATAMRWQRDGIDLVLLDARFELTDPAAGAKAHAQGHPPGAVHADLDRDLSSPKGGDPRSPSFTGRHPLPDRARFAATVGAWGIGRDTTVVCFDAQGAPYAARAWWLLRWLGHTRVHVLDGGLAAWVEAGGAMTADVTTSVARPPYPATPSPAMATIDATTLQREAGRYIVVDARAADRFRGENETIDPVAGHIPGARHRFFKDNLDAKGRFLSTAALNAAWRPLLGAEAGRAVHVCGSGVTACQNLLAALHAGFPAGALYPGSWSEWSADPARPVALGD